MGINLGAQYLEAIGFGSRGRYISRKLKARVIRSEGLFCCHFNLVLVDCCSRLLFSLCYVVLPTMQSIHSMWPSSQWHNNYTSTRKRRPMCRPMCHFCEKSNIRVISAITGYLFYSLLCWLKNNNYLHLFTDYWPRGNIGDPRLWKLRGWKKNNEMEVVDDRTSSESQADWNGGKTKA